MFFVIDTVLLVDCTYLLVARVQEEIMVRDVGRIGLQPRCD